MRRLLTIKFFLIVAVNVLAALAAERLLGAAAGWLAPGRAGAGVLLGELLPFFQFMAFAVLLDHLMWALTAHDKGAAPGSTTDTRVPTLALQIGSFLIYAALLAASINMVFGQSLAAILGASGVIGLVLGFALRGLVADVFSGIALQLDRSMGLGDWLDFQHRGRDISGRLLEIAWRTVVFADRAENIIMIPNGEFAGVLVTNRSRPGPLSEYGASIDLGAEHDDVRVRAILQGALNKAALEGWLAQQPAPYVRIAGIKEGNTTFRMLYCLDVGSISPVKVHHFVLAYALQFLKAAGIPVTRQQHIDISRPAAVGQHHFDQPLARLAMLGNIRFLAILPPSDLEKVAAEVVTLRLPAGQQLLQAGEPGDSMFAVAEGSLEVTIETPDGPVNVGRLWPGDCLGEMSLLTGAPRSANVRACEPSVLFQVNKETMAGIFASNPALIVRIAEMIEAREKSNESALTRGPAMPATGDQSTSILAGIRRFFRL